MANVSQASPLLPARQRAFALVASGDLGGARALLERAVELGKVNLSEDDPDVLLTAQQLGALLRDSDDPTAARRVLEEAYAAGQFRLGDADPLIVQLSHDLGVVAEELGNRHEARKAFGRVAEFGPGALGANHPAVARARAYLGQDPTVRPEAAPAPGNSGVVGSPAAPFEQQTDSPPAPNRPDAEPNPVTGGPGREALQRAAEEGTSRPVAGPPTTPFEQRGRGSVQVEGRHAPAAAPPAFSPPPAPEAAAPGREERHGPTTSGQPGRPDDDATMGFPAVGGPPPWETEGGGNGQPIWVGPVDEPLYEPARHPQIFGAASQMQPAASPAYPREAQPGRRSLGLFAAIAAVLAALIAVAALVFVLATRSQDKGDDAPTLGGPPPTDVRLRDEGARITVSWTDPAGGKVSFLVAMAHPGEQLKPVATLGPGQTSYQMSALNPALDYCFAVIAVYRGNKFATSAQACTER